MRAAVSEVRAFAVRGSVDPSIPFSAVTVLGRTKNGVAFELGRFEGATVEGADFAEDDILAGVEAGDLTLLPAPIPARQGMVGWLFAVRSEAEAVVTRITDLEAWCHPVWGSAGGVVLVSRPEVAEIRAQLRDEHAERAARSLKTGRSALEDAQRAWLYADPVRAIDVAALVSAYRAAGDEKMGLALREMERRSLGELFDRMVAQQLPQLQRAPLLSLRRQSLLAAERAAG